jgi:hypothetical protein
MSNEIAIVEPQEVQSRALTVEESVEFKLKAFRDLAKELKAQVEKGVPTIAGIGDKETYNKVAEWRKKAQKGRTGLDTHRLGLTEESRKYQALVNSTAKEITKTLEVVEDAFFAEENRIDKLIEADKAEKQRIINERVSKRTQELLAMRHDVAGIAHLLAGMPEDQYQIVYLGAKTKFDAEEAERIRKETELSRLQAEDAERQRVAAEAKAKADQEERERLEAQRKAQEEAQARMDAERAEIEREKKAIADAKAKQAADEAAKVAEEARKAREAEIAKEAAERARVAAEAKAKEDAERKEREAKEAEEKAKAALAAKLEKEKAIEAAKPDVEKLMDFADQIRKISLPALTTEKGESVTRLLRLSLDNLSDLIKSEAAKLTK